MTRPALVGPVYLDADGPSFLTVDAPAGAVEVLEAGDGAKRRREVAGLALPYGEELERPHWSGARRQMFAKGSAKVRDNAALYFGHDHRSGGLPVGRIVEHTHTDAGLKVRARFSKTPKADEVYELATPDDDGKAVLDRFSVGFYEVAGHLEDDGGLWVHDEIDVFEDSLVPDPAFTSAEVDAVLARIPNPAKETAMPCTLCGKVHADGVTTCPTVSTLASAEDVQTLSSSITELERRIATLGAADGPDAPPSVPGSSYGEFLQMVANRDSEAMDFLAFVGGTTGDLGSLLKDTWVGDRYRTVEAQRTVLNFFARSPLPATGMGVEYGVEGTDTTQVEKQLAEGDVLPYGKITFDTASAPLATYGGWGDMSFQKIQRAPVNVVERFFGSLLRRYARTTEAVVNARAVAAGEALTGGVLDMATVDGWTRFIIRAARVLKDRGYPLEGILVGFDVFEEVALMRDTNATDGDRFLNRESGRVSVTGLNGEVFNVPIIPIETGATADVIRAANSEAIRTYEASGAPFRLQDADITNLTEAASVYGYMADVTEVPGAIIKPATV